MQEPVVWALLGRKAGDNSQVCALAGELGWPCARKTLVARPWELLVHLGFGVTLAGIDPRASSALQPPWPDLVISAGRRNEPVARWIQRQSRGRTRLVHIGRPWAPLASYDLIVTTPQYFLPGLANVQLNKLPLYDLSIPALQEDGRKFESELSDLPRPLIALLAGGDSGRFVFTPSKGAELGQQVSELVESRAGSVLLVGSPRTPPATFEAISSALDVPCFSWRWGDTGANPYRAALALADEFVVTGESMSMLAEASSLGKPLHIFDIGDGEQSWWHCLHNYQYKPLSHHLAMALAPRRMRRDVGRIQDALVAGGRACWLGGQTTANSSLPARDELANTAARVRQLFLHA